MQNFKTESKKLMEMMIHSVYTNCEIFLRELISNASDAIDKMYITSLQNPEISFDRENFFIELIADKEKRTLTIKDTGIGMTKEELEENLGTIAHSDSLHFKSDHKDQEDMNIIGQFGVGFYSAFMVAKKVEVISKAYKEDQTYIWTSEGSEGYTIEEGEREEVGTSIILYLREDGEEEDYSSFLEEYRLRGLVEKYSNYIRYPIRMEVTKSRKKEDEEEGYESYQEVETLNSMVPIWEKSKNELKDEDYKEFYLQEGLGFDEPLRWIHIVADGLLSYRAILFIPSKPAFDYYTKDYEKGLALYSHGVKIMDRCPDLLPDEFSFVKGVLSSPDLSLNLSREILQQDRQLLAIARKLESKIKEELKKMLLEDRESYEDFFESFGNQLKAGIYESYGAKKDSLEDLLLFPTSKIEGLRTLEEVFDSNEKLGEETKKIYYATGPSVERIDQLPVMKGLKDKDIEVLYLVHPIDEFTLKMMRGYKQASFQSVLSDDFFMEEEREEEKKPIYEAMKEVLGDKVVEVKKSNRLVEDAVILVAQGDLSFEMEKTLELQGDGMGLKAQRVLEVNEKSEVFEKLQALYQDDQETFENYTKLLYDQACLIAGLALDNPVDFARRIQSLMI